ncbi:MAG: hypothetical protein AAF617_15475 [Bacteroidota bacterium]
MKKQTLTLKLKKSKIVNLSKVTQLQGGTSGQSDPNNPNGNCGNYDTILCTDFTKDKANNNNTIPTFLLSIFCIP